MAIYHLHAKVISRATGRSAVAAAAYRSASELYDARLDRAHDFTAKSGVIHSEVLLPDGAPDRLLDRATLWNEVERVEVRKLVTPNRDLPRYFGDKCGVRHLMKRVSNWSVDEGWE